MTKESELAKVISDALKSYNKSILIYVNQKKFDSAIKISEKSLKLLELFKLEKDIAETYYNIANIYLAKKDYIKTEAYLKKSKKIFENLDRKNDLYYVNYALGNFYLAKENIKKAFSCFEECKKVELFKSNPRLLNMLIVLYRKNKDYKKSIEINMIKLDNAQENNQKTEIYVHISRDFQALKNYKEAKKSLTKALNFVRDRKRRNEIYSEISSVRKLQLKN